MNNITVQFMTEKEVAGVLQCSISTLRQHRMRRTGIPWVQLGRSVRYRPADVEKFIEKQVVTTTHRAGGNTNA